MTTNEFVEQAEAFADKVWLERPADIDRMLQKNLAIDKNLATSCFAFADTATIKDEAWLVYTWGRDKKGDVATLGVLAAERLEGYAKVFVDYYDFSDTAELITAAAGAFEQAKSHAELKDIAYALNHCMMLMHYWCDIAIPWADLSPVHAELIRAAAAGAARV